ncbi:MAG: hypothetical protein ACETWQ_09625 [Phycisphaerae bacterium]
MVDQRLNEISRTSVKVHYRLQIMSLRNLLPDLLVICVSNPIQGIEHTLRHVIHMESSGMGVEVVENYIYTVVGSGSGK